MSSFCCTPTCARRTLTWVRLAWKYRCWRSTTWPMIACKTAMDQPARVSGLCVDEDLEFSDGDLSGGGVSAGGPHGNEHGVAIEEPDPGEAFVIEGFPMGRAVRSVYRRCSERRRRSSVPPWCHWVCLFMVSDPSANAATLISTVTARSKTTALETPVLSATPRSAS